MKLYVMRHGPAEDNASDGLDSSRALTVPGRERVRNVARVLVQMGEAPRAIVSSPLVRSLQTAEIVATSVGLETAVEANRALAPRGHAHDMVRAFAAQSRKRLMVVGHEPDVSLLVAQLLDEGLPHGFMKGMVVAIRVPNEGGPCSLRFVLDPKTLQLMSDHRSPHSKTPAPPH
ncbi:MAG: phosphohistidine phosphatase SixA [Deltaproteobacteria bacterium]|nr:phosphohistidine phosphatase SixA [Deltaproteobacteria bacterium]